MKIFITLFLIFCSSFSYGAKEKINFPFVALRYIIDGDTFNAEVEMYEEILVRINLRILGIDAPEMAGECEEEIQTAQLAKEKLEEILKSGSVVSIKNVKKDKYPGRILADVYVDDESVAKKMLETGLVRKYYGKKRQSWCHKD